MAVPRNVKIVNDAFGMHFTTRAQVWAYFDVPFAFAGLQQYRLNMAGIDLPDAYTDVTYASLNWNLERSKQARRLFVNRAGERKAKSKADLAEWQKFLYESGVAEWIDDVLEKLDDQGVPLGVELLTSPEINLRRGEPLFAEGESPQSLLPFQVNQAGEREVLQRMSVDELVGELWKHQYRFNHRPAGAPAPPEYADGFMVEVRREPVWQKYAG